MDIEYRLCCTPALVSRDFFDRALDFYEIYILISELDHAFENSLDLDNT